MYSNDFDVSDPNKSDVALLAFALAEAVQARHAGLVIGPPVDELAMTRAARRATRRDLAQLRVALGGVAA